MGGAGDTDLVKGVIFLPIENYVFLRGKTEKVEYRSQEYTKNGKNTQFQRSH